jgi:uncharacterized protein YjbJ (UPF0337 family)
MWIELDVVGRCYPKSFRVSRNPHHHQVACARSARRAITTSYQQSDHRILMNAMLDMGKGTSTWPETVKAQGTVYGTQRTESNQGTEERIIMKLSTDDQATGKLHEIKGAIKQKAGELTGNANLEADGRFEKNAGKVISIAGKIEKAAGK